MTSFLAATKVGVILRQNRAEHVERADVGRGLAASIRVRGEDEVCECLPQLHLAPRFPLGLAVFFANVAASLRPLAVSRYF